VATKLGTNPAYLEAFDTGQGVVGGLSQYLNYPADFKNNFEAIRITVDTMIDELAAARLQDAAIPRDILVSSDVETNNAGNGRFSPKDVKVSYTGTVLTIAAGDMFGNGQKIVTAGDTFSSTRGNGLYYIASDINGLLSISTLLGNAFVDVCTITVAANLFTTPFVDLLATDTQLTPLLSGDTINRIVERRSATGTLVGDSAPSIRLASNAGVLQDAGFSHLGTPSRFGWISQKATAEGSGAAVVAVEYREKGQMMYLEQARVFAELPVGSPQTIVTGAGFTPITFAAPVGNSNGQDTWRREPASYLTNPFVSGASASLVIPTGTDFNGTYLWTAYLVVEHVDAGAIFDVQIQKVTGGSKTIARQRGLTTGTTETVFCLSGYMDMVNTDSVQLQIDHTGASSHDVTFARLCGMLVGGPVTST